MARVRWIGLCSKRLTKRKKEAPPPWQSLLISLDSLLWGRSPFAAPSSNSTTVVFQTRPGRGRRRIGRRPWTAECGRWPIRPCPVRDCRRLWISHELNCCGRTAWSLLQTARRAASIDGEDRNFGSRSLPSKVWFGPSDPRRLRAKARRLLGDRHSAPASGLVFGRQAMGPEIDAGMSATGEAIRLRPLK